MRDSSPNRQVPPDLGDNLRASKPRQADLLQLCTVQHEVLVEDKPLVKARSVQVEKILREEREILAVPSVLSVEDAKSDPKN